MARQAEAERERRAKVIAAEGEVQAASKLAQAAEMIAMHPGALQLRLYQTLVEVSSERDNTIVFPVPIELLNGSAGQGAAQLAQAGAMALAAARKDAAAALPPEPRQQGQLEDGLRSIKAQLDALVRPDVSKIK